MLETNHEKHHVSDEAVLQALRAVNDPDLRKDIVTLGFVKNLKICGGGVAFDIELTTPACPVKDLMRNQALKAVQAIPGVETVAVNMTARVRQAPQARTTATDDGLQQIKNVIAIASGKGGVGKSTVATNLAIALAKSGAKVGLMDADVYGPSVPKMLGGDARPQVGEKQAMGQPMLMPLERHGIKFMSMGLLTGPQTPVIWRGPMATKLVQQFLSQVDWGHLDYLLIDLPPGTGDVQLTLTQAAPLNGAVIVTTPQEVAIGITMRGLRMFEQVQVPILGIIENMSGFVCPHCHKTSEVFGEATKSAGRRAAEELGVPFLGAIPLDPAIARAGDAGAPVVTQTDGTAPHATEALMTAAGKVAQQVSIINEKTQAVRFHAADVSTKDGMISVRWNDNHVSNFPHRTLRLKCPCAVCIDEWSGAARLDPKTVAEDVHATECNRVGRYALQFIWSDNHRTGIYPFDKLRAMDPTAPQA